MFQTYETTSSPEQGPPRLASLRSLIADSGLDGFLIPRADVHQGEYVAPCDDRLAWLTGFTGSAGFCAVLADIAGVFIDGRYRLQVRDQVAADFTPVHWPETQLSDWLIAQMPDGGTVGFDPWLHTVDQVAQLRAALTPHGISLKDSANLIDQIWSNRPAPPEAKFTVQPIAQAGEAHSTKCARLAPDAASAVVITLPDSIAWLLNIRSTDIARNPVPHAFAILHASGAVDLFARPGKADNVTDHLGPLVTLHPQDSFETALIQLSGPVQIDPKTCPAYVATVLSSTETIHAPDPCALPKARKNATEIAGSRAAHLRDAVAMIRFLSWVDTEAPSGTLTEIDVATALEGFRRDTNALRDISFETISGAGPNGAIVHYRVTEQTNRTVNPGELLLVDSGGQYQDGTTDITRTMIVGTPTDDQRNCYTRVLQGMIAISRARFPHGVSGQHLDALARFPLWTAGLDYDHGTGHGVGSYLSVHEGPQAISRRSDVPLEPGMIVSNEPGYYRTGAFGIRIENLIVVQNAAPIPGGDDRAMYDFETLTLVPFDRRLIDIAPLSRVELAWINDYHADILAKLGSRLDPGTLAWLTAACAPL